MISNVASQLATRVYLPDRFLLISIWPLMTRSKSKPNNIGAVHSEREIRVHVRLFNN